MLGPDSPKEEGEAGTQGHTRRPHGNLATQESVACITVVVKEIESRNVVFFINAFPFKGGGSDEKRERNITEIEEYLHDHGDGDDGDGADGVHSDGDGADGFHGDGDGADGVQHGDGDGADGVQHGDGDGADAVDGDGADGDGEAAAADDESPPLRRSSRI